MDLFYLFNIHFNINLEKNQSAQEIRRFLERISVYGIRVTVQVTAGATESINNEELKKWIKLLSCAGSRREEKTD